MRHIYIYHYHPILRLTFLDIFATYLFLNKKLAVRYIPTPTQFQFISLPEVTTILS